MNITRLRYFIAVAEAQHVGRAATALRVAQPALSKQLKTLEGEIGAPLFARHPRGVHLTPAGNALLPHAREAVKAADAGIAASRIAGASPDVLRISIPDWSHRSRLVAAAISDLEARNAGIVFQYSTVPWTVSDRALLAGDIDIGFHVAPSAMQFGEAIAAIPWIPEPGLVALTSSRHPLATRPSVLLKDLADTPTLIPSRDEAQALHDQMLAMIRSGGYEPRVITSPLNFAAAAQLVAIGAGWIISAGSIAEMPPPGTVAIPLEDAKLPLHLYILHRADDRRASIATFVDALVESAQDVIPSASGS